MKLDACRMSAVVRGWIDRPIMMDDDRDRVNTTVVLVLSILFDSYSRTLKKYVLREWIHRRRCWLSEWRFGCYRGWKDGKYYVSFLSGGISSSVCFIGVAIGFGLVLFWGRACFGGGFVYLSDVRYFICMVFFLMRIRDICWVEGQGDEYLFGLGQCCGGFEVYQLKGCLFIGCL